MQAGRLKVWLVLFPASQKSSHGASCFTFKNGAQELKAHFLTLGKAINYRAGQRASHLSSMWRA